MHNGHRGGQPPRHRGNVRHRPVRHRRGGIRIGCCLPIIAFISLVSILVVILT